MQHASLGLVVPMYNEAENAEIVIKELYQNLQHIQNFRLVVVNNGSTDHTDKILQQLHIDFDFIYLCLEKNQGYGGGILDGMKLIDNCDIVGWMWGDNQIDSAIVPVLYQAICNGSSIAKTIRIERQDGRFRKVQSMIYAKILSNMGIFLKDLHGCPKLFRRDVWKQLRCTHRDWFLDAQSMITALEHGYDIYETNAIMKPRLHGKSKVNIQTSLEFMKNLIRWYWQE